MESLTISNKQGFSPTTWIGLIVIGYAVLFFGNVTQPNWLFVGDTLNNFGVYSYQYSGFVRGEYPMWNPLVRAGQPEVIHQGMQLASPISNMVMGLCVLAGMRNIVLSFAIYLFVHIVLYALGMYLLVSCWTGNRHAGVLAGILSIGSSTAFFSLYHVSFILIVSALPWLFYAVTMYFREFRFRYLILFALAVNVWLYSYEFFLGAAYIVMLLFSACVFYYKNIPQVMRTVVKAPWGHMLALAGILIVIAWPNARIFMDLKEKFLVISRVTDIRMTDHYDLISINKFSGRHSSFPLVFSGFWATLFTGVFKNTFESLRHFVGPLAFSLTAVALFTRRKAVWCIALSGLLVAMLAGGLFPVNFVFKLPVFSLIGNAHFLLQFFLFVLIILAGFGFDIISQNKGKKIFNISVLLLILVSIALLATRFVASAHNDAALWMTIIATTLSLFSVNFLPSRFFISAFLLLAVGFVLTFGTWINRLPMSGHKNTVPEMAVVSNRSDHALQFRWQRPENVETARLADPAAAFGKDEFWSLVTLKDNSYKTMTGQGLGGLSTYPLLKKYYLFSLLPGHEQLIKNKFFFLSKSYVSQSPSDMIAFRDDPTLLTQMLARGVGLVDHLNVNEISLGSFQSAPVGDIPPVSSAPSLEIEITQYRANSMEAVVSVKQPGLFVYTDLWDKDWKAYVDGRPVPVRQVFHTFKGLELLPGTHKVLFGYQSSLFPLVVIMNILFIVLMAGLVLDLFRQKLLYGFNNK